MTNQLISNFEANRSDLIQTSTYYLVSPENQQVTNFYEITRYLGLVTIQQGEADTEGEVIHHLFHDDEETLDSDSALAFYEEQIAEIAEQGYIKQSAQLPQIIQSYLEKYLLDDKCLQLLEVIEETGIHYLADDFFQLARFKAFQEDEFEVNDLIEEISAYADTDAENMIMEQIQSMGVFTLLIICDWNTYDWKDSETFRDILNNYELEWEKYMTPEAMELEGVGFINEALVAGGLSARDIDHDMWTYGGAFDLMCAHVIPYENSKQLHEIKNSYDFDDEDFMSQCFSW